MSNPLPTPPRAQHARPPLPALRLAVAPRRLGPGAVVALVAHVALIGALIWERTTYLQGALGAAGEQGGGGGGGEQLRYVALPPAEAPRAAETPPAPVTEAPVPVPQALQLPEPTKIEVTPVTIIPPQLTVVGTGPGTGGGPGEVTGSGGGSGTTTGTGTGSNDGPGSGGDGGYIAAAVLRGLIIAPDCVRGRITVLFSVGADGRVADVDVNPTPKDGGCRRDLDTRLRQYKFDPARTRDGRTVASTFKVTIEH